MHVLVDLALAVAGAGLAVVAFILGGMSRRLRRANRVAPGRRSPAPLTWQWSPRRMAVLHRRLRGACQLIAAVTGETGSVPRRRRWRRRAPEATPLLHTAAVELIGRAVAADERLAELRRGGVAWRRMQLPAVAAEVAAVEAGAARLARLDRQLRSAPVPDDHAAESLLDAFEAALSELQPPPPRLFPPASRPAASRAEDDTGVEHHV